MQANGRSTKQDDGDSDSKDGCVLTVGSLFSGIGGLDLGFERAGFNIAWQCEKDSYCQKVLNKHWPNTPCYDNIEDLHRADGPQPDADILIGGFPCQDISYAGEGGGLDGDRSGLWWEYHRTICNLEPRYAVVENTAAVHVRGLRPILGSLAEVGYDAEWDVLPAGAFGARHQRDRAFLVAYPSCQRSQRRDGEAEKRRGQVLRTQTPPEKPVRWDITQPAVCRGTDGLPNRVDRIRGLGNAVVPQVAQFVAECVREHVVRTRDPRQ